MRRDKPTGWVEEHNIDVRFSERLSLQVFGFLNASRTREGCILRCHRAPALQPPAAFVSTLVLMLIFLCDREAGSLMAHPPFVVFRLVTLPLQSLPAIWFSAMHEHQTTISFQGYIN
jgi:hypothetical protein